MDQLQPKPAPGPFTGPVNVNELNRILRAIQRRLDVLETAVPTTSTATVAGASPAVTGEALTTSEDDDTMDWVL